MKSCRILRTIPAIACLVASLAGAGEATRTATGAAPDRFQCYGLVSAGEKLSSTQVEALEAGLARKPADLTVRVQLLAYWGAHDASIIRGRKGSPDNRPKTANHVLWIIRNAPEADAAGLREMRLTWYDYGKEVIAEARAAWTEAIKTHPASEAVLGHAASFFLIEDHALAAEYLTRAEGLDPRNPHWAIELGQLALLGIRREPDEVRRDGGTKASDAFDRALGLTPAVEDRFPHLGDAAYAAWLAGRDKEAGEYAEAILANIPADWWNRAQALNEGHTVLGLVALRAGDRKAAIERLAKSVDLGQDAKVRLFDPSRDLAEGLLAAGERQAVLDYLAALTRYVKEKEKVETWVRFVRQGGCVNFREDMLF
jgi:tetratricopeptide (TPR) repeat protein